MNHSVFRKTKSGLSRFPYQLLLIYETKALEYPYFSYKQAKKYVNGLTYRRISFWDSQGFISGYRTKENTGWRKFSIMDLLYFNIITDLRILGVSSSFIKNTIDQLENKVFEEDLVIDKEEKTIYLKEIQARFMRCLEGGKTLISIFGNGQSMIMNEKDTFIKLPEIYDVTPVIILPFHAYVIKISSLIEHEYSIDEKSTISDLLKNQISIKEQAILDLIRNDKYREIIITKKNKDKIVITAESVRSGNFSKKELLDLVDSHNYQDVKVSRVDGRIIKIYQNEKIKL